MHHVNLDKAEKVYASKIFDSITYIPLETTDIAIVGQIKKLEIVDSLLYLLDTQTNTIWCFDQKGKYVSHIHKRGQGPGEYVSISDFTVDRINNQIVILDRNTNNILWYTFSGKFVKNRRIGVSAIKFCLFNDNKILAYTMGSDIFMKNSDGTLGYNYFVIDSADKIAAYFPYSDETDNLFPSSNIIEVSDNKIWATYAANDTVYEFNMDGNLILKHVIDFDKYRIPIEKSVNPKHAKTILNNPKYAHRGAVYCSDKYTVLSYSHENRVRFILRNNKADKSIIGNFLENDIDFISLANPEPLKIQDNKVYYFRDADFIIKQKHDGKPAFLNIPSLFTLDNEDNPVLMVGHLKF